MVSDSSKMHEKGVDVTFFTDGACLGNPGPGGWAYLKRQGMTEEEHSGSVPETTNNRMELLSVIKAFESLKTPFHVAVYTDSQYVEKGMTLWVHTWLKNGWRNSQRKAVKNQDLWEALLKGTQPHQVQWHWVKGHAGHKENERADYLAQQSARSLSGTHADGSFNRSFLLKQRPSQGTGA